MKRVEVDARVGGGFHIDEQRGDSLAEHTATYLRLERPGHIVFEFAAQRGIPTTQVDIAIAATAEGARLTLTQAMDPAWAAFMAKSREGWGMILDGLDSLLAANRTVVSRREIGAPREVVFAAFADPQRFARWWGPAGFSNTVHDFDLRVGAMLKYTMHGPDGSNYAMERLVMEYEAPSRVVVDNLDPSHRFTMTQTFTDRGDKTLVTWRMRFESAAEYERVWRFIVPANEQNFDRLAAEVATTV